MSLNPVTALARVWNRIASGLANPQRSRRFGFLGPNNANVPVTHETAFMVAAVWACIDVISASLAASDWNVYAGVRGADDKKVLPNDGLQYVLNTRFNPEMTAQSGKRALGIAAAGYGNGYAEIERDLSSRIVAMWPIVPNRVEVVRNEEGRMVYRVTQDYGGGFVDLEPENVFHIRGGSVHGFAGDDMVSKAIQTIAMAIALDQFGAAYFANGTQIGGVIESAGKLDDAAFDRLTKQWNSKHQGAGNAFKVGILEGGVKFSPLTTDAEKAQLIEAKYQIIEEVCRWFRVPPHKIAHLLRATNNNIEHQGLEFSRDTLRPWVQEIQQEADFKLIPYRTPKFLELDVDWAEQGDYMSRAAAYQVLRGCGVFSVNDVLRKLGENTIGKVGDVRTMNGAAVRLEDVGKNMLPKPGAGAPPSGDGGAAKAAWLTSVYARIARRHANGARDMRDAGHADWEQRNRSTSLAYARSQVDEMAETLGEQHELAQLWAIKVLDGTDPNVAALAVLEN